MVHLLPFFRLKVLLVYISFLLVVCGEKPIVKSRRRSRSGKKLGAGAAWKKIKEPELEPLKKVMQLPSPGWTDGRNLSF